MGGGMEVVWPTAEKGGISKREEAAHRTQWAYCTKDAGHRYRKKERKQPLPVLLVTFCLLLCPAYCPLLLPLLNSLQMKRNSIRWRKRKVSA